MVVQQGSDEFSKRWRPELARHLSVKISRMFQGSKDGAADARNQFLSKILSWFRSYSSNCGGSTERRHGALQSFSDGLSSVMHLTANDQVACFEKVFAFEAALGKREVTYFVVHSLPLLGRAIGGAISLEHLDSLLKLAEDHRNIAQGEISDRFGLVFRKVVEFPLRVVASAFDGHFSADQITGFGQQIMNVATAPEAGPIALQIIDGVGTILLSTQERKMKLTEAMVQSLGEGVSEFYLKLYGTLKENEFVEVGVSLLALARNFSGGLSEQQLTRLLNLMRSVDNYIEIFRKSDIDGIKAAIQ